MKQQLIITILLLSNWLLAQNISGSFTHGGITRNYTVHIPTNYNANNSHPLVFNLHGYTSNGTEQAAMTQMNAIADTAGFLVAYPEGTLDGSSQQYWNAGYGTSIDDIGFINALIDTLAAHYNVNLQRVYSTGISNGGIMSNTLACELDGRIAAIAGVGGTMSVLQQGNCSPSNKIPVMHIHGTSDAVVVYTGSALLLGVDALVTHWRTHNGLTNNSTTTPFPNTNIFDGCTAELIKYETGSAFPVHLIRVINGGHSWPGSGVFVSGTTNMDFNASLEIWKFFSQYSIVTSITEPQQKSNLGVKLVGENPIHYNLSWQLEDDNEYTVKIYNSLGTLLLSKNYYNKLEQLNLENLAQGIYIAVFETDKEKQAIKFVKN